MAKPDSQDYIDFSCALPPACDSGSEPLCQHHGGSARRCFPVVLHDLLTHLDQAGFSHFASWQPHGRSFKVHQPAQFVLHILPLLGRQTQLASFKRQLGLYGFSRMLSGPDKGSYYHQLFLRGKRFLAARMKRTKIKGTSAERKTGSSQSDPDFFCMSFLPSEIQSAREATAALQAHEMAPSTVGLLRDEFPLLSDCARLLSVGSQIPSEIPRPTTVAALTNLILIERAIMLKAPPSISIIESVLNHHPASLIPAMPDVIQPFSFGSRFVLGGINATGSNAVWPVPTTDPLFLTQASSRFLVPAPPKLLDPAVLALLRELTDRHRDL